MKLKTVLAIFGLIASIINLIEGYPRNLRKKPIVNLNPDKSYTTKSIEERKNTLFPRNTKKYVVTERPHSRLTTTYPSSFKYFVVKRPLMLKFDEWDTQLSKYESSTHQPFMKNIKYVVSTPSQSELDNKKNHWKDGRPIHIRANKTTEENYDEETSKLNKNKETITPKPFVKVPNNAIPTEAAPESKTGDIIILPVYQEELKSNPNEIADEVNKIIAFVNKIHKSNENTTTEVPHQTKDKEMTKTTTVAPIKEVTKSSSATSITHTTINNEGSHPQKQTPTDESKIDVYFLPETNLIKPNRSSIDNDKMTISSSPLEKSNKSVTAESPKQEIVFIPVNLSDLKSHPNLVADEVQKIVDSINTNVSSVTNNNTTTTFTTSISSSKPQTSSSNTTVVITTQMEKTNPEKLDKNMSSEGEYLTVKSHDQNGGITTEKIEENAEGETTSNSSIETLIIPAVLTANDIKSITKYGNKNELSTIESPKGTTAEATSSSTSNFTISTGTTITPTQIPMKKVSPVSEISLTTQSQPENITAESEVIFVPVNFNDFQSNPVIAEEVRDIVEYMNKIHPQNATTEALELKTNKTRESEPAKGVSENSFSTPTQKTLTISNPIASSSFKTDGLSKPTSDGVHDSTSTDKEQVTLRPSQEIVFIPINLKDFKSNPDLVVAEVNNIVRRMNDFKYSATERSTESSSATNTSCNGSYCSDNSSTSSKTETSENVSSKYMFIEPIEVTAVKDDDDDDIYVGKPFHKQNETKQEGHGRYNSTSDDISDVIYVIKKNNM